MNNSTPAPFIRTKEGCFLLQRSAYWGDYYIPIQDPKGIDRPPEVDNFILPENFPKLPYALMVGIVSFFRQHVSTGSFRSNHEVQVCLLRGAEDPSLWKAVVPKQEVTTGTVDAETAQSCDLFTGEEYTSFPPAGWYHAGSVHSHQRMPSFWSPRDDNGELEVPGMHCTVGSLAPNKFSICASIVINKRRYIFDPTQVIEFPPHITVTALNSKSASVMVFSSDTVNVSSKTKEYITKLLSLPKSKKTNYYNTSYYSKSYGYDFPEESYGSAEYWMDTPAAAGVTLAHSDELKEELAQELSYFSHEPLPESLEPATNTLLRLDAALHQLGNTLMGKQIIAYIVGEMMEIYVRDNLDAVGDLADTLEELMTMGGYERLIAALVLGALDVPNHDLEAEDMINEVLY